MNYDAIIIGAGHNCLVCAFFLARAGLKVLVLERRGGICGRTRIGVKAGSYGLLGRGPALTENS